MNMKTGLRSDYERSLSAILSRANKRIPAKRTTVPPKDTSLADNVTPSTELKAPTKMKYLSSPYLEL
jgi:hypothetical protein